MIYGRFLIVAACCLVSCQTGSVKEGLFEAHYSSSTSRVELVGLQLKVTRLEHEFANPVSAVPSSTKAVSQTALLKEEDLNPLKDAVRNSGFLRLPLSCGAPAGERHYPYTVRIVTDSGSHEVVYRSNPSFPDCPKAFHDVEGALLALTAKAAK